MKRYQLVLLSLALITTASLANAQTSQEQKKMAASADSHATHVLVTPDKLTWGPAPPSLPPGSELAILEGDPSKAGDYFAFRAKLPDGYKVPPHWHPTDERVVVLQGTLGIKLGDKFEPTPDHEMSAGSYAVMPKGVKHFAWAKGETVIQVSGMGPFDVMYVNPADDPRNAGKQ